MGRSLGKGTVAVLTALRHRVTYGLDIVAETGLLPGTVYTTLRRLEKRGFVEGRWEDPEVAEADRRPRRRYYALTEQGEEALDEARSRRGLAPLEGAERFSTSGGSA
jgi:PadR family transcriptional regulator PadR